MRAGPPSATSGAETRFWLRNRNREADLKLHSGPRRGGVVTSSAMRSAVVSGPEHLEGADPLMTAADVEQQITSVADFLTATARKVGHSDIAARLVTPLRITWGDLDALPRTEGFWSRQMNHRATIHKLEEYARQRVDHDPADRMASRTLVAVALNYGANDGGLPYLTPEVAADPTAVGDAVIVAFWIWHEIGLDTTFDLQQTLSAVDQRALAALARNELGWTTVAAHIALDVLGGLGLDEAYACHSRRAQPQ
jgi:hypothetical protein